MKPLDITLTQTGDREGSSENAHVLHELEVDDGIKRGDSDDDEDEYFVDVGREGQTFDETVEEWIRYILCRNLQIVLIINVNSVMGACCKLLNVKVLDTKG